jgi:hypothetical protein
MTQDMEITYVSQKEFTCSDHGAAAVLAVQLGVGIVLQQQFRDLVVPVLGGFHQGFQWSLHM